MSGFLFGNERLYVQHHSCRFAKICIQLTYLSQQPTLNTQLVLISYSVISACGASYDFSAMNQHITSYTHDHAWAYSRFQVTFHSPVPKFVLNIPNYQIWNTVWNLQSQICMLVQACRTRELSAELTVTRGYRRKQNPPVCGEILRVFRHACQSFKILPHTGGTCLRQCSRVTVSSADSSRVRQA